MVLVDWHDVSVIAADDAWVVIVNSRLTDAKPQHPLHPKVAAHAAGHVSPSLSITGRLIRSTYSSMSRPVDRFTSHTM